MLNLQLRDEFLGSQTPGTAIALAEAVQRPVDWIQEITYPTADVQNALRAISASRGAQPIVLMGERGRGKSHIMAVMHYALSSPDSMEGWARDWGNRVDSPTLKSLSVVRGYFAISEAVHNQEYPVLWDLLFDRHPKGDYYRGQFEALGQPIPPRSLLEKMFHDQPVALILDEFQKWFDGLHDETGPTGRRWQTNASTFIQVLSEISRERPKDLILAISVLNNQTEAFRQVHRNTPVVIDFRGPTARQDRQRLLLHRLFTNRGNIPADQIRDLVSAYAAERFRLRFAHLPPSERDRIISEVSASWPFAPELLELLEDQILMAEAAQETRDLIRILAQVFQARGESIPLITAADFFVDDDACGVTTLLDSIATAADQEKLRAIAQRNLESIVASGAADIPHARELISALWMRSLSPGKNKGATRQDLQLDITRGMPQDDNAFRVELGRLEDHAPNIHGENERLWFELEENPTTRVRTIARNNKLWEIGAVATATSQVFPGEDINHIRRTFRSILSPEAKERASRIIVLGPDWYTNPWKDVDEADHPTRWDRPVLLVIPDPVEIQPDGRINGLGEWLKNHVPRRRNTVRFLLLAAGAEGIYHDQSLIQNARGSYLTSVAWRDDPKYRALKDKFDKPLRDALKTRFDRFAILRHWDFPNPAACVFEVERVNGQGEDIPAQVESKLQKDLFDPGPFEERVLYYAQGSGVVGDVLDELYEPPSSPSEQTIPFLGENRIYEQIEEMAARGMIALNIGGAWIRRLPEHTSDLQALGYIRSKGSSRTGSEMRAVQLALPEAVGGTTVIAPKPSPVGIPVVPPAPMPGGTTTPEPGTSGEPTPEPQPQPNLRVTRSQQTDEPATGINLSGKLESWGVPSEATLTSAKLEFRELSVSQLKAILSRIPSTLRAWLEISYTDEDDA